MNDLKFQSKRIQKRLQVDIGSEFISKDFNKWA